MAYSYLAHTNQEWRPAAFLGLRISLAGGGYATNSGDWRQEFGHRYDSIMVLLQANLTDVRILIRTPKGYRIVPGQKRLPSLLMRFM